MQNLGNPLIVKAKKIDQRVRGYTRKVTWNDDEMELAGSWFEGDISTAAVAEVMGCSSSNVVKIMASALKQAVALDRVKFTWYPPRSNRA